MRKKIFILVLFLVIFISFFMQIRLTTEYWIRDITNRNGVEYEETVEFQKKYNFGRIIFNLNKILIEFYDLNSNLNLEKIDFYIDDKKVETIEINKKINDLEVSGERHIDNKKLLQKTYFIGKKVKKIWGSNNKKYEIGEGELRNYRLDIYIKDIDTNKVYIIKRDVEIEFEGRDVYSLLPPL